MVFGIYLPRADLPPPESENAAAHTYDGTVGQRVIGKGQIDDCYSKIPSKYKRLQAALGDLAAHYEKNEAVAYYADLCDMSEVSFRRLFREYTGKSPVEYRNDLRLSNARIKLRSGEYNVSEASGFSNLSYFIRLYKKKYGYTKKKE